MKLPWMTRPWKTRSAGIAPVTRIPAPRFPEITLRAAGVVPPIMISIIMPRGPMRMPVSLGNGPDPAASTPMKLPAMILGPSIPRSLRHEDGTAATAIDDEPRTVSASPLSSRHPFPLPLISIASTALSPRPVPFVVRARAGLRVAVDRQLPGNRRKVRVEHDRVNAGAGDVEVDLIGPGVGVRERDRRRVASHVPVPRAAQSKLWSESLASLTTIVAAPAIRAAARPESTSKTAAEVPDRRRLTITLSPRLDHDVPQADQPEERPHAPAEVSISPQPLLPMIKTDHFGRDRGRGCVRRRNTVGREELNLRPLGPEANSATTSGNPRYRNERPEKAYFVGFVGSRGFGHRLGHRPGLRERLPFSRL